MRIRKAASVLVVGVLVSGALFVHSLVPASAATSSTSCAFASVNAGGKLVNYVNVGNLPVGTYQYVLFTGGHTGV